MGLLELELQVLDAFDRLREVETALIRGDAKRGSEMEEVYWLRLLCHGTETRYIRALEDLGLDVRLGELSGDSGAYCRPGDEQFPKSTLTLGHDKAVHCVSERPDGVLEHTAMMHGGVDVEVCVTDEAWDLERRNLEALMKFLRSVKPQTPQTLSQLRAEQDASLSSMAHQRAEAETESSKILTAYKDSLNRLARLSIEIDALHAQLGRIRTATDVDLNATATLRTEIARYKLELSPANSVEHPKILQDK